MTIERNNSEIIIRIPGNVDTEGLQRLLNFLTYKEATVGSKASQEDINKLTKEVNNDWWKKNQDRFLKK